MQLEREVEKIRGKRHTASIDDAQEVLEVLEARSEIGIEDPLVKRQTLAVELGQSLTTIWRWTSKGYLPCPVKLGQTVGWPRSVINAWKVKQGWPAQ